MALVMSEYCPRCGERLVSNAEVLPEQVVVACKSCERFMIQGDTHWVVGDDNQIVSQLTTRLEDLQRDQEARDSDENDPRWERF